MIAVKRWSGRRDSNSRHPPWQGGILPLNYFRPPVPRPGIGPGTRRFSVYQQGLTLEILQHLSDIGQAAEHLLRSIELDNSIADENNESPFERLDVLLAQHNQGDPEQKLNEKHKQ